MNTARILSFILLPLLTFAQAPAPYPVLVDSQRATVPALEVFQANAITFRASFKSGNVANAIVTESPFFYWQPFGATNATVVTANWSIVSAPSGVVDFAFTPADLNFAAGTYSYQVGLEQSGGPQVIKQGLFTIKPSQASIGAAPIVFATTNINWGSINWTGLPAYEYQTNTIAQVATLNASIATASNALSGQISAASNALNDRITAVSNSLFATSVAYSNALHTQIQAVNDASKWSQFQATQTVNMANNGITNAGNVQAVSINGDGAAISIPHIHGTLAGNIYIHIRNGTTNTIAKGTPVYVIGNVGAGDRKLVAPAQSGDPTKMPAIALAEANLTANADGDGVILGEIRTYNTVTNAWTVNTELYVAPLGGLTKTAPTNGLVQSVGQVSRTNNINGIIVAQIQGAVLPKELFLASTTTFVAVESDPIFAAVSNSINTRITAVETGKVNLSVYTPATQALWTAIGNIVSADNALTNVTASGRIAAVKTGAQVALTFDSSGLATGTPIYSVDGKLDSNTWAAADSTTNYASRLSFVSVSNTVAGLSTNVEARLASNVWASADSTTNYALRTTFVTATNALNNKFTNYLPLAGGTMSGALNMGGDDIVNVSSVDFNSVNVIFGGDFNGPWTFDQQPTIPGYLTTSTWATADSTTNYASRIAFVSVSNTVTALGTNVEARLASNVWAAADSTTNYAPRTSFVSVSNTVVALGTNVAARLASNVWAAADSTTNYALRTTFVTATNSLQTDINTRLASNVWAAADSTTNYASRITFNATSNALNSSITSLAARAFVYSTNLTAIAGSGLGVVSNQLVVTNVAGTVTTNMLTNYLALAGGTMTDNAVINMGEGVITNISKIGFFGGGNINHIDFEERRFVGSSWQFQETPLIPGYVTTNTLSAYLTITAGNANYWRITTAPTGSTSSAASGRIAVEGTNLYIYSPNALGTGTGRWGRVGLDVSW
jgi:hypothetical protein